MIESGALMILRDRTRHVRAVQVINGTKPELLRYALDGERYIPEGGFTGSFILRG